MSGIVATLSRDGTRADPDVLARLTAAMRRRGPDAEHVWLGGPAGLGHTLLATVDGAAPVQPATLDGNVWITADARVDARAELATALRAAGRDVVPSTADVELILHAYAVWGARCATQIAGDYAFVLWDARRGQLVAARSGFGVRPLYWARVPGALLVGNTIPALLAHPACSHALDARWLAQFIAAGHGRDPESTVFGAIRRVLPGHTLVADADLALRIERHWSFPEPDPTPLRSADDVVGRFRDVLGAAVADRLRTQDAAIFLSGGLDSPTLAATADAQLRNGGGVLRAYTSVLEHLAPDDEGHYAALVAQSLGLPHHCFAADAHALVDARLERAGPFPEPVDDPLLSVFLEMAGAAAAHARVALYGEDGDALLRPPNLRTMLRTLPLPSLLAAVARHRTHGGRMPHLGVDVRGGLRRRMLRGRAAATPEPSDALPWLRPDARRLLAVAGATHDVVERADQSFGAHDADQSRTRHLRPEMYGMLTSPLWPPFLESMDPGFTGLPLEIRFPLLDPRVIAFAASIPPVPWCQDKALFRMAMRDRLPPAVLTRPKVPVHDDVRALRLRAASARLGQQRPLAPPLDALVDASALPDLAAATDVDLAWRSLRVHIVDGWLRHHLPRLHAPAPPTTPSRRPYHVAERTPGRRAPHCGVE